jgi:FixJ family two-component response regulator
MMEAEALVFVVDDDAPLRASLENLLRSVGLRVAAFASASSPPRRSRLPQRHSHLAQRMITGTAVGVDESRWALSQPRRWSTG